MSPSSHVGALTPDVYLETEPLRKCLRSSEVIMGFPGCASGKESVCQWRICKKCEFDPWVGKIPWRRAWQPSSWEIPKSGAWQDSVHGVTKSQTGLK